MMSGRKRKGANVFSYNNSDGELEHTLHLRRVVLKNTGRLLASVCSVSMSETRVVWAATDSCSAACSSGAHVQPAQQSDAIGGREHDDDSRSPRARHCADRPSRATTTTTSRSRGSASRSKARTARGRAAPCRAPRRRSTRAPPARAPRARDRPLVSSSKAVPVRPPRAKS